MRATYRRASHPAVSPLRRLALLRGQPVYDAAALATGRTRSDASPNYLGGECEISVRTYVGFPVVLRGRPGTSTCSSAGEPTTSRPGRPRMFVRPQCSRAQRRALQRALHLPGRPRASRCRGACRSSACRGRARSRPLPGRSSSTSGSGRGSGPARAPSRRASRSRPGGGGASRSRVGSWFAMLPWSYVEISAPTSHTSLPRSSPKAWAIDARPSRSDFTSVPVRTSPASKRSSSS